VYKVLALNCLVSAYMMSALYLRGLKQGDTQMTATGLFFLLSQAKPVLHISAQKPTSTIFARAVLEFLLHPFRTTSDKVPRSFAGEKNGYKQR
jgi:manganese-transporting P-type ATPase